MGGTPFFFEAKAMCLWLSKGTPTVLICVWFMREGHRPTKLPSHAGLAKFPMFFGTFPGWWGGGGGGRGPLLCPRETFACKRPESG